MSRSSAQTSAKPASASASTEPSPLAARGRLTRPTSGSSRPARMRQSVVLPAPLGPTRPILSRSALRHDRSRKRTCPPNDLAIDSTAISASSQALDGLGLDLGDHAHLAGPAVRILVLARVLLGQCVDVLVGALLGHLHDAPAHLHVAIRVVRVLHGERDHRVRLEVLVFHAATRRVDANVRTVEVTPHGRDLGAAVAADGGEVAEGLLVEDVAVLVETRGHGYVLPVFNSASTENAWRTDLTASVPPMSTPMSSVSAISASVAPWSRTSSTRWSTQSKQFCETATASAVSSLCFLDSAPSANTSLPISPTARYTFIGDFSIRPLSRFFSVLRSWTCIERPPVKAPSSAWVG